MGHPSLKKRSKRMSCRTRYKIDKKVREHNRKLRRKAKDQPKSRRKPDIVIAPNLCPFKEKIIEELNVAKTKEKEILLENKMIGKKVSDEDEQTSSLIRLIDDAQKRARGFGPTPTEEKMLALREKMESVSLVKEFKKVVAAADVILEVIDARDPLGTRCKVVEETVLQYPSKRLVLVVNKADLVPRDNLEMWLSYLRRSWPTVPFKASVQQQTRKLGRRAMVKISKKRKLAEKMMSVSSCVGAEFLMRLLANYRRNKGIMTSITVGVVGVPNVGKSSVINSLKRTKSCAVGAVPGVTRTLQTVQIGTNVKILDSPGIVTESPILQNQTLTCLKNLLRCDRLIDPLQAAQTILLRATKEQMKSLYNVPDYSDTQEFLLSLAKRFGLLAKGGVPDRTRAAHVLVQDWNRGKIRFYTLPPEDRIDCFNSAEIVNEHAADFDIDNFEASEKNLINMLDDSNNTKFVTYFPLHNNVENTTSASLVATNTEIPVDVGKKKKLRWRKKNTKIQMENPSIASKPSKILKLAAKKKRKEEARKLRKNTTGTCKNSS